jgi:hypothetical protein
MLADGIGLGPRADDEGGVEDGELALFDDDQAETVGKRAIDEAREGDGLEWRECGWGGGEGALGSERGGEQQ